MPLEVSRLFSRLILKQPIAFNHKLIIGSLYTPDFGVNATDLGIKDIRIEKSVYDLCVT